MPKWLIYAGSALVASFIGFGLYANVTNLAANRSAENVFGVVGMLGLLLILGATALQRSRS